jgi:hypothetical protein
MINKAKLVLIAAVAAVSVVSPALAQSQIVSPPNTAVPPSLFVPQTVRTCRHCQVQALVVPRLSRTVRRVAPMRPASLARLRPAAQLALATISSGSLVEHTVRAARRVRRIRLTTVASEGVSPCYVKSCVHLTRARLATLTLKQ